MTGVANTGYSITGSTLIFNAPSTNNKAMLGTVTNANSNFAYSPRNIQIGAKFTF